MSPEVTRPSYISEIKRDQLTTIILVTVILFGLLGLPLLLQHIYGIDAVKTAFGVIIVYALINWYMQNRG